MPHSDPEVRRAYQRDYQRKWARENRDKRIVYEKNWNEENAEKRAQIRIEYRKRHPEKINARNSLRRAISLGKIERKPCEVCGGESQAHHEDYSKPLDVRWLCRTHHMEMHRCAS